MKVLTDYLELAVEFEKLAANEQNKYFRINLLKQAALYQKLASKHAEQSGLPMPSPPMISN
jgi:hypothetical protein